MARNYASLACAAARLIFSRVALFLPPPSLVPSLPCLLWRLHLPLPDKFSESYPSVDVSIEAHCLLTKKQERRYNTIYHLEAFVQHPVSRRCYQAAWGWRSVWRASADAEWQWHKEGAHHTGPDRAVFHRGKAWLDFLFFLKAHNQITAALLTPLCQV